MSTIAQLIIEQGRQAAEARRINGEIWGGATARIAQIPAQVHAQTLQDEAARRANESAAQENKLRGMQISGLEQQQADKTALDHIYAADVWTPDNNLDIDKAIAAAQQMGAGHMVPIIRDEGNKWNASAADLKAKQQAAEKANIELQEAHAEQLGQDAQGLASSGYDPGLFAAYIGKRAKDGLIDKDSANTLLTKATDAASIKPIVDGWIAATPSRIKATQAPYTLAPGQVRFQGGTEIARGVPLPPTLQSENVLYKGKPIQVTFDPKSGIRTAMIDGQKVDVTGQTQPIPSAAALQLNTGDLLSEAAKRQAAQKYLETGQLPPGMGAAAVKQRTEIMNLAAQLDPNAALARNQAVYKADSANLTRLQTTEGALSAFETAAGKNLDQFLALAAKIPDTGVPWLNTPVRLLDEKVVGSANMAAISAARDVALREIGRVTSDPRLTGALTDSARQEVLGLSPKDATLPQIKAVAAVLRQDMRNVHEGLSSQIQAIKDGLGANPAGGSPNAPPPGVTRDDRVRVKGPNGETGTVPKGTALPAGWSVVP